MKCGGCHKELEVGDRYIEDTASGYLREGTSDEFDGLIADILGSGKDDKILFCEDCTTPGGDYMFETVYGDEADGE